LSRVTTATSIPYRFVKAAVQRLMEVLARGEDGCRPPALALLREVFAVPGARLGPPSLLGGDLLQPLARLLDGAHAPLALQVREPGTGMLGMRSVNHRWATLRALQLGQ